MTVYVPFGGAVGAFKITARRAVDRNECAGNRHVRSIRDLPEMLPPIASTMLIFGVVTVFVTLTLAAAFGS